MVSYFLHMPGGNVILTLDQDAFGRTWCPVHTLHNSLDFEFESDGRRNGRWKAKSDTQMGGKMFFAVYRLEM